MKTDGNVTPNGKSFSLENHSIFCRKCATHTLRQNISRTNENGNNNSHTCGVCITVPMAEEILKPTDGRNDAATASDLFLICQRYNSMEWGFIKETLKSMSFHINYINIIMNCINILFF